MRNSSAIPCDSTKMSFKAYKDKFIKHLNIIVVSAQKNKTKNTKHKDIGITVREVFGYDSVKKACSYMQN